MKGIQKKWYVIVTTGILFAEIVLFVLLFRKIRDGAMPPPIGSTYIVGYTQYFGYPFYLDTGIFFFFVLTPVIILWICSVIDKRTKKSR